MHRQGQAQPLLVEIVGTAGAGKTSLLQALRQSSKQIQPIFDFGNFQSIPYYIGATLFLLPVHFGDWRRGGRYTLQEIKWMVRLQASYQIVRRKKDNDGVVTVMDQGPIYTLARLLDHQCTSTKGAGFMKWWMAMLAKWAETLDIIICLDAPVDVLLQRVYARSKWHSAKAKSEQEAREMLAHMQRLYAETLATLPTDGQLTLVYWDTSLSSVEEIAQQTLHTFKLEHMASERLATQST